ncbi:MAG: hypothetical protein ACRD36_00180 [Candidatus Acidiferrum sp.]
MLILMFATYLYGREAIKRVIKWVSICAVVLTTGYTAYTIHKQNVERQERIANDAEIDRFNHLTSEEREKEIAAANKPNPFDQFDPIDQLLMTPAPTARKPGLFDDLVPAQKPKGH